jgi:hypothetical protein
MQKPQGVRTSNRASQTVDQPNRETGQPRDFAARRQPPPSPGATALFEPTRSSKPAQADQEMPVDNSITLWMVFGGLVRDPVMSRR